MILADSNIILKIMFPMLNTEIWLLAVERGLRT